MNKTKKSNILALIVLLSGCSSTVTFIPTRGMYPAKPESHYIEVYYSRDNLPKNVINIGTIKVNDSGFAMDCHSLDNVIGFAKERARQAGGDIIKITQIYEPDYLSTCYRVDADVFIFSENKTKPLINPKPVKDNLDENELFILQYSKSKVEKYFATNNNLDPVEGMYTYKLIFPGGREIVSGDVGITRLPHKPNKFMALFYKSWQDSIPDGIWGFLNPSAVDDLFYGDWTFGGESVNTEFRRNGVVIDFVGYFQNDRVDCHLVKMYPIITSKAARKVPKTSTGSGFLLTGKGLVVTNYHVIEDSKKIEVSFASSLAVYPADVVLKDISNDLAILKIRAPSIESEVGKVPFRLSKSSSVRLGQDVFTIGFPLGQILGYQPRLSMGEISSLYGVMDDPRLFQISNPLQPGNSGGALFNEQGEIVGIVVSSLNAKYLYENANIIPQNVNFAIKSDYLINLITMFPQGEEILHPERAPAAKDLESLVEQIIPFVASISAHYE